MRLKLTIALACAAICLTYCKKDRSTPEPEVEARDMDANNYFSHISPGGTSPIQRTMALGYAGNYVSENIARGFSSLEPAMEAWQKSEDHCKTMMDPLQTHDGPFANPYGSGECKYLLGAGVWEL